MQSITSTQETVLSSNLRNYIYKVYIYRDDYPTTAIDISSRTEEITIEDDFEARVITASLVIDNSDYTMHPGAQASSINLVGGVYNPLLYPYHKIVIQFGVVTSAGNEYWTNFTGLLGDSIDTQTMPGKIILQVRDMSKKMMDTFEPLGEIVYDYSTPETIIQDVLNRYYGSSITFTFEATNSSVTPTRIQQENIWNFCQKIADATMSILKFNESGTLELKQKNKSLIVDRTFNENEIERESLSLTDADIRNHITMRLVDAEGNSIGPIVVKNQNSINQFGTRKMEISQNLSGIISSDNAYQMAQEILDDLSWIHNITRVSIPLFPPIQTDDIVAITDGKAGLDESSELFKVIGITHNYSADRKRTELYLRSYKQITPQQTNTPKPPTSFAQEQNWIEWKISNYPQSGWTGTSETKYFPKLIWNKPTLNEDNSPLTNLAGYLIYRSDVSSSSGFKLLKNIPAQTSLVTDITSYIDYSAKPLTTYWYKIQAITTDGNKSSDSGVIQVNVPDVLYT